MIVESGGDSRTGGGRQRRCYSDSVLLDSMSVTFAVVVFDVKCMRRIDEGQKEWFEESIQLSGRDRKQKVSCWRSIVVYLAQAPS